MCSRSWQCWHPFLSTPGTHSVAFPCISSTPSTCDTCHVAAHGTHPAEDPSTNGTASSLLQVLLVILMADTSLVAAPCTRPSAVPRTSSTPGTSIILGTRHVTASGACSAFVPITSGTHSTLGTHHIATSGI